MSASWYVRFLASTRGRIIAYLRRDTRTVEEMASELGLTDNAVRAHLATLERDGLVHQSGVRRGGGVGKPAYSYELTDDARRLFPKPYAEVLSDMLAALDDQMPPGAVEELLRRVGRRIASDHPAGHGDRRARLATASEALNQLGGLTEVEESDGRPAIQGFDCPLAALVPSHPEVCQLAESLVSEVAGMPVHECCQKGGAPRCRFEPVEQP